MPRPGCVRARVRAPTADAGRAVHLSLPMCSSYLLPHLLPSKPGLDTHGMQHPKANTIQRVFKMSFVPVGFWQRFIARMLISLAEMDLQVAAASAWGRAYRELCPFGKQRPFAGRASAKLQQS